MTNVYHEKIFFELRYRLPSRQKQKLMWMGYHGY